MRGSVKLKLACGDAEISAQFETISIFAGHYWAIEDEDLLRIFIHNDLKQKSLSA